MDSPASLISGRPAARVIDQIDRFRAVWFSVVGLFLLASWNGQWQVGPDSAAYRQLGHELATTGRYFFRSDVPGLSEYHNKQSTLYPGLPILLAGLEKVFGPSPLAPILTMQLLAVLTLILIYRVMLYRVERWVAVCVVVGVGTNPRFLQYANEILSDIPFLLSIVMTLLGYEWIFRATSPGRLTRGLLLLFAGLILAVAMRPTFLMLFAALGVACAWGLVTGRVDFKPASSPSPESDPCLPKAATRRRSVIIIGLLVLCVVIFSFALDIRRKHGKGMASGGYESRMTGKLSNFRQEILPRLAINLSEAMESSLPTAFLGYRMDMGLVSFGGHRLGVGTLVFLIVIPAGIALCRRNVFWGALVAVTTAALIIGGPIPRYFLMILPLLLAGWGLLTYRVASLFKAPWRSTLWVRLGLGFVLGMNISAAVVFITTQHGFTIPLDEEHHWVGFHHVGFLHAYRFGEWAGVYDLAEMIHKNVRPGEKNPRPRADDLDLSQWP